MEAALQFFQKLRKSASAFSPALMAQSVHLLAVIVIFSVS